MSQATYHPLEAILRMCAQAAPEPWHPRVYALQSGVDPDDLNELLELLWLERLVQKAPGAPGSGPGITLTPLGQQVVNDPEALDRLRRGQPLSTTDAGAAVRQSLRRSIRPVMTQLLVLANVLVFAYGALLASRQPGGAGAYLSGTGGLTVLNQLGMLSPVDVVEGKWWRLLTTTFLHGGILHIAMNMYTLYIVGAFVEQTWGRWRLLLIYFLSGWGGSCFAMAYTSGVPVVGASGAICGVLATEGVWVLLYGRHLPKSMARRGRSQMVTTLVLMVVISLIPRVSGWAHLGGAVTGAAAAVALHFQRFGRPALRGLAWPVLLFLPVGNWEVLQHGMATQPRWARIKRQMEVDENSVFLKQYAGPASQAISRAMQTCENKLNPLMNQHPGRRDPGKVDSAITALQEQKEVVERALGLLSSVKTEDGDINAAREKGEETLRATLDLLDGSIAYLQAGEKAKKADEKKVEALFGKVDDLNNEWDKLLEKVRARDDR